MKEENKSKFLSKVEEFAKEVSEMTTEQSGINRAIVILASEKIEGSDRTTKSISVAGNGFEAAKVIAEFATRPETRNLVKKGLELATIKEISEKFGGGGFLNVLVRTNIKDSENE